MIRALLLTALVLGVLTTAACRKRSTPTPAPTVPAEVPADPAAAPAVAPTSAQQSTPPPATTLPQSQPGASENSQLNAPLSDAVARFREKRNRLPVNWQELVQGGFIQAIPQPSSGKRFAIDPISYMVVEL